MAHPKVVCICGSTRFTGLMEQFIWEYAKQGIIALGWCVLPANHNADGSEIDHHLAEREGVADTLDLLHLRKIDLADEIMVLNVDGYIGKSTSREIAYATKMGKRILYLEQLPASGDGKDKACQARTLAMSAHFCSGMSTLMQL